MNDFMQQPGQLPQPFAMDQMRQDLPNLQGVTRRSPSPGWAAEFDPGEQARMEAAFANAQMKGQQHHQAPPAFSPQEFAHFQQASAAQRNASPMVQTPPMMNGYQRPMGMGYMGGGMNMGMNYGSFNQMQQQPQHHMQQQPLETTDKGKGRMVELDDANWEAQFKQLELQQDTLSEEANKAMEKELEEFDR